MKTFSILLAGLFLFGFNANANVKNNFADSNVTTNNYYGGNPVNFIENGIAFNVYLDGRFDYDPSTVNTVYYNDYGRRNANGYDMDRDYNGRILRLGNVTMDYDSYNRVTRIGSVYLNYNNYGLFQVGGLQIFYDGYNGGIRIVGSVRPVYPVNTYPAYPPVYPAPRCGPAVVVVRNNYPNYGYGHYNHGHDHGNHYGHGRRW